VRHRGVLRQRRIGGPPTDLAANDGLAPSRGPDDEGFYLDESVALGVRRLSIIDLETGRQPIANEDGTVWVVQNGEIYNFESSAPSWSVAVTGSVPRRTRKFRPRRMNSTEVSSCPAWTACLPSPSGTPSTAP